MALQHEPESPLTIKPIIPEQETPSAKETRTLMLREFLEGYFKKIPKPTPEQVEQKKRLEEEVKNTGVITFILPKDAELLKNFLEFNPKAELTFHCPSHDKLDALRSVNQAVPGILNHITKMHLTDERQDLSSTGLKTLKDQIIPKAKL